MMLKISKELAEKVAQYLARCPWIEVKDLLPGLITLEEIKEVAAPKAPAAPLELVKPTQETPKE